MKAKILSDHKFIQITECTEQELQQLQYSFKKRISSWKYHPLCRKNLWDGYFNFLGKGNIIPIGLWNELEMFAKKFDYELEIENLSDFFEQDFEFGDFKNWVDEFFSDHPDHKQGGPKEIRDYQIETAYNIIKMRYSLSEIATSAGKTLIIFIVFAFLFDTKRISRYMIVVPNTSLIIQTQENFEEYNNGKLEFKIQPMHGGTNKKKTDCSVIIGTFQTLCKLSKDWFEDIDCICIDESHYTTCTSCKTILTKCPNLKYRYGLSGTAKKAPDSAEHFTLQAYLGPFVNDISAKFLIDNNYVVDVNIKIVKMNYLDNEVRKNLNALLKRRHEFEGAELLNMEKKLVIDNRKRFLYVCNFISKTTKNSLVLFADIKYGYGKKIYEWLQQNTDKKVYYIDGGTGIKQRTQYFEEMEEGNNKILCASFLTVGTGISVNNIRNVFLTESYKSDKMIRQAIGRGLRKNKDKTQVTIIDFVDDFSLGRTKNYLLKHAEARMETYNREKFPYKIHDVTF